MKEYLGLGVVFSAIDKGLAKSLKFTAADLGKLDSKMKETEKTANGKGKKGGIFHGLYEGLNLLSLSHIGGKLTEIQEAMAGTGGGIEDTFKKLDTLKTKLTFTFDGKQAESLNNALLTTMHTMGLTGDETEIMAQNMMEFGRSADEAVKSLPMMGTLVGKLGLDAGKVSQMFGQGLATLRATPDQLSGIIKEVVGIQKAYKLTDQVSQLPEIFEAVTKNSAMFGKVNAQTALSTVRSISSLSAVFQKVGLSQTQALHAATGFGDKLSSLKRSVSDMRAGLEPLDSDLFDAAQTLSLMGYNGQEAFNKIFKGADDPLKLAKDLNAQFANLSEDQQNIVAARFRRVFGDEMTNLLQGYGEEAKKAFAVGDTVKPKDADKTFDTFTKAMGGTVEVQERLRDSAKAYMEIMSEFVNKDKTIAVLQAQTKSWDSLTKSVTDADSVLGKVINTLKLFEKFGLAGFFEELSPFGILLGLMTPLIFPLANLVSLFKIFGTVLFKVPWKLVTGSFSLLAETLGVAGLGFKAILKPVTLLKTIFEHLFVTVGVKLIDAFEALKKVGSFFRPLLKPLQLIGSLFEKVLGFGARLIKGFGMLGRVFSFLTSTFGTFLRVAMGPLMAAFRALALVISLTPVGWITAAIIGLGAAIAAIVYYWDDIKAAATEFFDWIGPILSDMTKRFLKWSGLDGMWEGMKEGFGSAVEWCAQKWAEFTAIISGTFDKGVKLFKEVKGFLGFGGDEKTEKSLNPEQKRTNFVELNPQPKAKEQPNFVSVINPMAKEKALPQLQKVTEPLKDKTQVMDRTAVIPKTEESPSFWQSMFGADRKTEEKAAGIEPPTVRVNVESDQRREDRPQRMADVVPMQQQPGVPAMPSLQNYSNQKRVELEDQNFQAIIDELERLSQIILKLAEAIMNRPVNVEIQGDVKKFFKAISQEQKNAVGTRMAGGSF